MGFHSRSRLLVKCSCRLGPEAWPGFARRRCLPFPFAVFAISNIILKKEKSYFCGEL